ncbi:hypothetical protein [Paenibacillus ferrarius]|uniref:hypothetical protein n=1 Tax=Paenibacillus ferrarius TaxID=1469647 RepID=UPI003D26DFC4
MGKGQGPAIKQEFSCAKSNFGKMPAIRQVFEPFLPKTRLLAQNACITAGFSGDRSLFYQIPAFLQVLPELSFFLPFSPCLQPSSRHAKTPDPGR